MTAAMVEVVIIDSEEEGTEEEETERETWREIGRDMEREGGEEVEMKGGERGRNRGGETETERGVGRGARRGENGEERGGETARGRNDECIMLDKAFLIENLNAGVGTSLVCDMQQEDDDRDRRDAERERQYAWLQTKILNAGEKTRTTKLQNPHASQHATSSCNDLVSPSRSIVEISDSEEDSHAVSRRDIENVPPISLSREKPENMRMETSSESLHGPRDKGDDATKGRTRSSEAQKRRQEQKEAKMEAKRRKEQEKANLVLCSGRKAIEHVEVLMDERFVSYLREHEALGVLTRMRSELQDKIRVFPP
eukprot:746060-Hanusia_phi.AAC.1